ncbi:MAG: hypothetical protein ACREJ5_23120 [Geminicoccaceae bacterium]
MATFAEQVMRIVRTYRETGGSWPASSMEIAEWAVTHDLYQLTRGMAVCQCAEAVSRAMREEYITDKKGRRVRRYHAARMRRDGRQMSLWADIETAVRSHMETAFAQRRLQIVGDCRQLKTDVDSFNDSHSSEHPIQVVFDFTTDLEELEQLDDVA